MNDNSEYCVKINVNFEEKQKQLCIDCIHYDSEVCVCCYGNKEMIDMIEKILDNLDKNNVKDVAYVIWIMCQDIEEDDVMGTKFRDTCRETYDQYGMYAPWDQVWNEIEDNYI